MKKPAFNPNIHALGVPPIPYIQQAARAYTGEHGPLVDLSQAVPGYSAPTCLLDSLRRTAGDPTWLGYGAIEGERALRSAYANDINRTHKATISADHVMITAGCNQAFVVSSLCVASPGQSILLSNPWYFNHQSTLSMLGIHTAHAKVDANCGFIPSLETLANALTPDVRAIAIVSPNNPTGAVYPPALIRAIFELCIAHGIWLILDETYQDFLPEGHGAAHELLSEGPQDNLIVLSSFSKSYCIPGHRLGAAISTPATLSEMSKVMDNLQICAPRAPQVALAACMPELLAWREENRSNINQRAEILKATMNELPNWHLEALGAYFAYVRHPWPEESSVIVAERLARERGVVTLPGEFFGPKQEKFLRVAFANVESEVITELAQRLPF